MTRLHRVVRRGIVVLALAPAPILAQSASLRVRENLRAEPNGDVIAVLEPGLALARVGGRDGWAQVDLEGWVWLRSLQGTSAAGHDLVVAEEAGENLRAAPSGAVVGKLGRGTLLDEAERVPGWVRVRRRAWIWGASLDQDDDAPTRPPAAVRAAPAASRSRAPTVVPGGSSGAPDAERGDAVILAGPGGDTVARVVRGAPLQVLAREGSWARVRVEGWTWLPAADSAVDQTPVEALPAELAADPERFRGRVVSWELQFLSVERAERIRTEFLEGEPYLLTRHPAGGYVYVALAPDQLARANGLLPLERIRVQGRVRAAASALTGSPILDLLELERTRDRR